MIKYDRFNLQTEIKGYLQYKYSLNKDLFTTFQIKAF